MKIIWQSNFSVHKVKFYWNTHAHLFTYCHDCLHYSDSWTVQQTLHDLQNLKHLPSGPLQKNFSDLHYIVNFFWKENFFLFLQFSAYLQTWPELSFLKLWMWWCSVFYITNLKQKKENANDCSSFRNSV